MVDLFTCIEILLGARRRSLHLHTTVEHDGRSARFGSAMFADNRSNRLAWAIHARLMRPLNILKAPMIATEICPARALKRGPFGIRGAGDDH